MSSLSSSGSERQPWTKGDVDVAIVICFDSRLDAESVLKGDEEAMGGQKAGLVYDTCEKELAGTCGKQLGD